RAWLRRANESSGDPRATLGKVIVELMEVDTMSWRAEDDKSAHPERDRVSKILGEHGLTYIRGGFVLPAGVTVVSRSLGEIIRSRDLSGLQTEFDRIYSNVESGPP